MNLYLHLCREDCVLNQQARSFNILLVGRVSSSFMINIRLQLCLWSLRIKISNTRNILRNRIHQSNDTHETPSMRTVFIRTTTKTWKRMCSSRTTRGLIQKENQQDCYHSPSNDMFNNQLLLNWNPIQIIINI